MPNSSPQALVDCERERQELRKVAGVARRRRRVDGCARDRQARALLLVNLTRDLCELFVSATSAEVGRLRNEGWTRAAAAFAGYKASEIERERALSLACSSIHSFISAFLQCIVSVAGFVGGLGLVNQQRERKQNETKTKKKETTERRRTLDRCCSVKFVCVFCVDFSATTKVSAFELCCGSLVAKGDAQRDDGKRPRLKLDRLLRTRNGSSERRYAAAVVWPTDAATSSSSSATATRSSSAPSSRSSMRTASTRRIGCKIDDLECRQQQRKPIANFFSLFVTGIARPKVCRTRRQSSTRRRRAAPTSDARRTCASVGLTTRAIKIDAGVAAVDAVCVAASNGSLSAASSKTLRRRDDNQPHTTHTHTQIGAIFANTRRTKCQKRFARRQRGRLC